MRAICILFVVTLAAICAVADGKVGGTFVQKKSLHDVGVTLVSTGTWSFEKDRAFVWNTLKPVPSIFVATPTNYSFTVGGRTTSRRLDMKIENIAHVFEMKEMKGVVDKVESDSANLVFKAGSIVIPSSMRIIFKNGDRLEISLKR